MDHRAILLITGILLLLTAVTVVVAVFKYKSRTHGTSTITIDQAIIDTYMSRVQVWWAFFGLLVCAMILGTVATTFLFFIISFWALREYVTATNPVKSDHKTLFFVMVFCVPLQYILVGINDEWFTSVFCISNYLIYSILIPMYAFLLLPAGIAISGDPKRFLERISKMQFGLLLCVYSLSFAPALLTIDIPNERHDVSVTPAIFDGGVEETVLAPLAQAIENAQNDAAAGAEATATGNAEEEENEKKAETIGDVLREKPIRKRMTSDRLCLLCVFIFLVQMSDVFQHLWSQFFRRGVIAKDISMSRTWGGVLAGALSTSLLSMGLWHFMPLPKWWQPLVIGFAVSIMGFAGSITFSAIKRDREMQEAEERKEKGQAGLYDEHQMGRSLVEGHAGILNRIDSLCFAAPIYFHLVWLFLHMEMRSF